MDVPIKSIRVTDWNPRQDFNQDDLNELKASIEEYGILEPLIVRPKTKKTYELVAGERRFRAARELKLKTVPVVVKDLTDSQVHEVMLIENLQRSQLQPLEEAQSLEVLLQEDITQEQLAKKLGKSQSWIANRLRLLTSPDDLKDMVISREISPKHVITLLPFVKYENIFSDIMDALRITFDREGKISVKALDTLIQDTVGSYGNENVLRLDDIPWGYRDYDIDLSGCAGCKDAFESDRRYCLNTSCWKDKVATAKNTFEKKQSVMAEKLGAKGIVDTHQLDYDLYNVLGYEEFDKSGCESCENFRVDQHQRQICLDPACFKKKKSADTRAKNKVIRDDENSTWQMLDTWLEQKSFIDHYDIRRLLWFLLYDAPSGVAQKAMSPWGEFTLFYQDDINDILKEIPEDQYLKAMLRLSVSRMLTFYESFTCEAFLHQVPPADISCEEVPV